MFLGILKKKRILRPLQGFVLSLGSPLGWMAIQSLSGTDPFTDIASNAGVYIYMTIGTALAFSIFGFYVGTYEARMETLALVDPLTGLYNNRYFHERLHQEFALAARNKAQLSIVLFDLDHFKRINDRHGHLAGDKILREVSKQMRKCSRQGETIARVGGEEICVILPDLATEKLATVGGALTCGRLATSGVFTVSTPSLASNWKEWARVALGANP